MSESATMFYHINLQKHQAKECGPKQSNLQSVNIQANEINEEGHHRPPQNLITI